MCMMSHNKAFFLSLQHAAVSGVAVCLSVRRGAGSVPAGNRGKNDYYRVPHYWDACSRALPDQTRYKYVEQLVDLTLNYHYDASHGLDNFDVLKR